MSDEGTEPTGNVIDTGSIYITFGMDEDADDIIGVSVIGGLADDIIGVSVIGGLSVITALGLLTLAKESILTGRFTRHDDEEAAE